MEDEEEEVCFVLVEVVDLLMDVGVDGWGLVCVDCLVEVVDDVVGGDVFEGDSFLDEGCFIF